jgi:hypothetical protein
MSVEARKRLGRLARSLKEVNARDHPSCLATEEQDMTSGVWPSVPPFSIYRLWQLMDAILNLGPNPRRRHRYMRASLRVHIMILPFLVTSIVQP